MKKALTFTAVLLALSLCLTAALAAGGSAGDPLISLSYLQNTFAPTLEQSVTQRVDAADKLIRSALPDSGGGSPSHGAGEITLKRGDVLSGSTGMAVLSLAGDVRLNVFQGAVVDATAGREMSSGELLPAGHRCVVAENASASFTVESVTAVVVHRGGSLLPSTGVPDYYAIAAALRSVQLLRGSDSGIGESLDLSDAPTRAQGLIMFIRVLGEEEQALACTAGHPFTDVPQWLSPYVAWGYQQGYTNGTSLTEFSPNALISPVEFMELLLRATGYSTLGVDDYSTSLERAADCGALTQGEYEMLTGERFTRAHVAYLCFYCLDLPLNDGSGTLAQRLLAAGVMTQEQFDAAQAMVTTVRLR